ncbi:MAG: lysyl oxidase family protein [Candidatus Woesearchaeota archaeon]
MSAPFELHIDSVSHPGHVLLRATSSVNNFGTGPIELRAHHRPHGPWTVEQAIYDRRGRVHFFATKAQLVFKFVPGYRYANPTIGSYRYWKVSHIAAFQLWSIDARFHALQLVRVGPKVDYCLRDLIHTRQLARSPINPVYPACSQDPGLRSDVLGTSAGWSDVYPYEYPQQWIDVSGLRGRFAFVMIVDPLDLFQESSKSNNVSETYVALPSGRILGRRVGVAAP